MHDASSILKNVLQHKRALTPNFEVNFPNFHFNFHFPWIIFHCDGFISITDFDISLFARQSVCTHMRDAYAFACEMLFIEGEWQWQRKAVQIRVHNQ